MATNEAAGQSPANEGSLPLESLLGLKAILNRAHLGPPPVLSTPLFVWHLGVWKPIDPSERKEDAIRKQFARLLQADLFIANLYAKLALDQGGQSRTRGVTSLEVGFYDVTQDCLRLFGCLVSTPLNLARREFSCPSDVSLLGDGQQHIRSMCVSWFGLNVTFQFEVHSEYVTFTTYIDLSGASALRPLDESAGDLSAEKKLNELDSALINLNKLLSENIADDGVNYADAFEKLYRHPRKTIQRHLLGMENAIVQQFGTVFADFRGLVLSAPPQGTESATATKLFFSNPRWRSVEETSPSAATPLPQRVWQSRLKTLWPFLAAKPTPSVNPRKHEFSISTMLGGRVLVATALGIQPQEQTPETLPLFYFVYANGTSARQTGRLMEMLTHLGTYRVAALLGTDKMHRAAPLLGVSEDLIRATFREILHPLSPGDLLADNRRFGELNEDEREFLLARQRATILAARLPKIGSSLNDVMSLFVEGPYPDNFERRIELSRYYARLFRKGVGFLRIGRIEGFLPYDRFVERRLGAAYGYMDLLASRFRKINADVNTLRQTEITQRSRLAEGQTADAETKVSKLQDTADKALMFVLIPYYAGEVVIEKIFHLTGWYYWVAIWGLSASVAWKRGRRFWASVTDRLQILIAQAPPIAQNVSDYLNRPADLPFILTYAAVALAMALGVLAWRYGVN